jgi:hypothetical protein
MSIPDAPASMPIRTGGPWRLRLLCCGRDAGTEWFATWDEANAFRMSYIRKLWAYDHDRVAILEREDVLQWKSTTT